MPAATRDCATWRPPDAPVLPLLTREQERALAADVRRGGVDRQRAIEALVAHNEGLVRTIAARYASQCTATCDWDDLLQAGRMGLLRAVESYDPDYGGQPIKFSTYATHWVRQAIRRVLMDTATCLRIPVHRQETTRAIQRAYGVLAADLGREPTNGELADKLHMSPETLTYHQDAWLMALDRQPISLDKQVSDSTDEPDTFTGFVRDPAPGPEDQVMARAQHEQVDRLLATFGDTAWGQRLRAVIRLRFGLDDEVPRTLAQVGEVMGITRERVRQLEADALTLLQRQGRQARWRDLTE